MRAILLLLILAPTVTDVLGQSKEWRTAKEQNSIAGYEQFVVDRPGQKDTEAFQRRCELFQQQLATHFSMDLIYRQLVPDRLELIPLGLLERGACHEANLRKYEEAAFAEVMASSELLHASWFALWWPQSIHMDAVAEHAFQLLHDKDEMRLYRSYAKTFPRSPRLPEVMDRLCQLRVSELLADTGSHAGLAIFLRSDSCATQKIKLGELAAANGWLGDAPDSTAGISAGSGTKDGRPIQVILEDDVLSVRHLEMTLNSGRQLQFMAWASPIRENYQLGVIQAVLFHFANGDSLRKAFPSAHYEQVVATMGSGAPIMRTALWNSLSLSEAEAGKFKESFLLSVEMIAPFAKTQQELDGPGSPHPQILRLSKRDQRDVVEGSALLW